MPKDRNCILMGNHQCLLDPVTLALCVPDREIHFMGKKELFENKALGWVFRQVHGFPVDRGNMDMGAIRTAMGVLKAGETLGIFPEGTRSKTGHMLPLLGGASLLALKSGCDVVPVYIEGQDAALGIKGKPPAAQTDIPLDELPPGQAANARLKLRQMEGLGEIVVCAGIQPVHLIRNLAARGENQHAGFKVALAKRAQDAFRRSTRRFRFSTLFSFLYKEKT